MNTLTRVAYTIEQCWHRVPGGTAVAGIALGRALTARGDIEMVGVAARHSRPPPDAWKPGIEVRHLFLPRAALYRSWHTLRRPAVQTATGDVDVIHATTIAMPPRSAPLVVTIHDLLWRVQPDLFTRRGIRFFEKGLEIALREADLVMCASRATRDDCEKAGFPPARIRSVPLGVDALPTTQESIESARTRYGLRRPYILWTGTREPRKNLRGLLEAFERVQADVDLVLVGPPGWKDDPTSSLHHEGIHVLGFIPQADLGPLYAGAEAFCFPSLYEGFGFPVLEAMAQGTPVITSRSTSTEELAEGAGMLVDPRDPSAIAEAIDSLLGDAALRERLSSAGVERAATYTWERTASLTAAVYEEARRL